jgi:flagellar L-ring protein precursor FlgH
MIPKSKSSSKLLTVSGLALLAASAAMAGSLWREDVTDERGMFADKRAKRVGDILTIIVQETASVANSVRLETKKESDGGVKNIADTVVKQFVGKLPDKFPNLKDAKISTSGQNSYSGGGEVKNSQTIATRAAVQVIDVLPNGNLVVEGLREISFSKERQYASLRGLVRIYDIQPDNTVLSSNVADARIEIVSEGTLTDAQKKGWLLRLNDKLNPF